VKPSSPCRWFCSVLAAVSVLLQLVSSSHAKPIRLRNETIITDAGANASPQTLALNTPASGLFLIQFRDHPQPAQQSQLRALGVDLIRYVPDDAFVARLKGASLSDLRALGFVQWVGPFRPDHKIHPGLRAAAGTNAIVIVNILLSPRATAAELAGVRSLLSSITHETRLRQGTIIRATIPSSQLAPLSQSDAVLWIERASKRHLSDEVASKLVGGDDGQLGTPTVTQQLGFAGAGVTVGVADTGLADGITNTMHPDLAGRVSTFLYYGTNITNAADQHSHGTHVAGIIAGNAATGETDESGALYGLGVASQATLVIQRIFDAAGNEVEPPPSDAQLARDAVRAGAKIGSNSWGNDSAGAYDIDDAAFDELVRDADSVTPGDQPYILEFSAGNAGPYSQSLDSPASGKNVIATGASENGGQLDFGFYDDGPDTIADFSSRGPCEDGRLKPDLVAPGTFIASLLSSSASSQFAWLPIDNYYIYMGGTSQAGPHASGAAAVFVQYYKSLHTNTLPSPALVKAALINSASELDQSNGGPGFIPNNDEGWGRITLTNIIGSSRAFDYVDQTVLLQTGQTFDHHIFVQSSGQPLKITLAYTDVPGFPGAIPALVNDLDLEVTAPDSTLYRGNQFALGESIPNAPTPDNLNNVEAVHLAQPLPGDYLVRVRARNVVQDARLDTSAVDQDFALVSSGDLLHSGTGLILLDRADYTAPGSIRIEVLDSARAASNTVTALLKSTTESAGENYVLHTTGNYGAFTGAVATVVGNAAVDGKLEIHGGDIIEADYTDASSTKRIATAMADLIPPAISNVVVTIDLGVMTITWQTSEPANSIVRYSTNFAFNLAVTNNTLTTDHVVKLANLIAGKTYNFYVTSSDTAGNSTTNNNAGGFYSFVAVQTPPILLVDAYETADGSAEIPDSAYTNALAATGFGFSFWKVTDRGSPQLADLQPFKAVIWRLTDDEVNYDGTNNTLNPEQQVMIQDYLSGGGSFLLASMGVLSQLGDVPFRRNVLQVARFVVNGNPPFPCTDCDEDYGVPAILGAAGDPVSSGINETLDYTNYPSFDLGFGDSGGDTLGPDFSDTFTPGTNATPIVFESVSGKPCGMRSPRTGADSPSRVVFLSFPLDTVPATGSAPNNETALLDNILKFLLPGANGIGTISLDSALYTVPDHVTVEVADSDLAGAGQAHVTFTVSSATNRATITLQESSRPGVFRGSLTLVASNASAGQLPVHGGNVITAAYFDASGNSNVLATAGIDTTPPVISNIAATPGYASATITWTTSKPADSLVQAGESVLLDRVASDGAFVTNHAVTLNGLSANHTYYYQVTSRDQAGNTTVADNNDNLYTFHTLKAPQPPWFDDLESGASNWTVVPDPDFPTEYNWTLGTPNNGLETSAYSGTNAWGSDLYGQIPNFGISTYLYSPVIDLSGLTHATLVFYDSYDFSQGNEEGQIMISTNDATPPGNLPVLADFSGTSSQDWGVETTDLTPYVGHTVRIVWDYVGVSFGGPMYGWLIDDISITGVVANATSTGTLVISKNLGQGGFTLTGQLNQTGNGLLTTISNAPVGEYNVQFDDVAFYDTPVPQTGTLAANSTLTFAGAYTFTDANHNGISDAWEQYYFGSVSTNRTQFTDSDGDGMTDYAEFIAGTIPTNAASKLNFLSARVLTNDVVELRWAAIPGRLYQVNAGTNGASWTPMTDWLQATGSPMTFTTTNSGQSRLFRIQVRP